MSGNVPPGYRLYAAVVARLDWVRECGGGLTFHCPLPARHRNGDRNPSGRCWVANDGSLMLRCLGCGADAHDLLAELGLPITECFPDKGKRGRTVSDQHPEAKAVEEYQYHDRAGVCLAVKTRWEPGFNGRPKDFTWWRPVPADVLPAVRRAYDLPRDCVPRVYGPGCLRSGEYSVHRAGDRLTFRATTDGDNQSHHLPACCLGLYRLPGLLRANPAHPVLVVEGERKADTLTALGFVATSGYAGKGKWETGWASDFAGRRVVVVPDRDPGDGAIEYARKVAGSSVYYGAASVRVVELPIPELKPDGAGGDILDWLKGKGLVGGDAAAAVARLCKGFPEYKREGGAA